MAITDEQIKDITDKVIKLEKDIGDLKEAMKDINAGNKSIIILLEKIESVSKY